MVSGVSGVSGVAFAALACGGGGSGGTPGLAAMPEMPSIPSIPETCNTRLAAAAPAAPAPAAGLARFEAPKSTIVVHGELPLTSLRGTLEARVPRRLAEERDHDIGAAGRLEYTVDRGAFALRVEDGALVVEAPLRGEARACAKGRCYASCAPEAMATARVPLRLSADYKLKVSDLRVEVTRGCQVRALGGFLKIDVTPVLRSRLVQETPRIRASIDRELPDLGPQARRLWTELEKPRPLPLPPGACVVLAPEAITQGPASGTAELARLRFGLVARPELRLTCGSAPPGRPMPPLRDDLALPTSGDVHLATVLAPESVARAIGGGPTVFDLGAGRARARGATGDVAAGLGLDLVGEVCGDVAITSRGVAWRDERTLRLAGVALAPGEPERLSAGGVDGAALVTGLETAPIAVPLSPEQMKELLPELARGLSDKSVTVEATIEGAKTGTAGVRGRDVVAVNVLRGSVALRAR